MKKIYIIFAILFLSNCFCQVPVPNNRYVVEEYNDEILSANGIDIKPEFSGGINEFYKYLVSNYDYLRLDDNFSGGSVIVEFVVEKDGLLSEIKLKKDIGFGVEKEMIRVLKNSPKWKPGEHNNRVVRTLFTLPINLGGNE